MSPQEIGLLVMKIQDDDVLGSDKRRVISALMNDEEIRRNAKLVSTLSGLDVETRKRHCIANVLMLLTASALGPSGPPSDTWVEVSTKFVSAFHICVSGPWKDHITAGDMSPLEFQRRVRMAGRKGSSLFPEQRISKTLAGHVQVLEEFWGVRGLFLT